MPLRKPTCRAGRVGPSIPLLLLGFLVVGAIVVSVVTQRSAPPPASEQEGEEARNDPRLTFESPFLNVRPNVRYVGDQACAGCHGEITDRYHRHPMGRSLANLPGPAGKAGAFDAANLHYESKIESGRLVHGMKAIRPDGGLIAECTAPIGFVIGSGGRGHSYLFAEDGYLFQSPISWYASRDALDLSPGYRERNAQFDRPVDANCLFCHANRVLPVEATINRYREEIFSGHAIGCERCHGPGELHVREPGTGKGIDHTIVNPKHLDPTLREAICQQCHLQGQARVLRAGRGVFDFRPGLPLELFVDTFVWHPGVPHGQKAVGHVEQMVESACYTKSAGKLGCASCHDPHEKPAATKAAEYYRSRCLACHTEKQCGEPLESRRMKSQDACAACHMPRAAASDVVHVSVTDHRIPRAPGLVRPRSAAAPRPGEPPLVSFHGGSRLIGREDAERNMALALVHLAGQTPPGAQRDFLGNLAATRLNERPPLASDTPARMAHASALRLSGRPSDALAVLEPLLERSPRHERALVEAATASRELTQTFEATGYWRRAIEVSPRRWNYHHQLAGVLAERRDWSGALAACAAARQLSPFQPDVRLLEVGCLLNSGRREGAQKAFAELMELKPPRADELKRWFDEQLER